MALAAGMAAIGLLPLRAEAASPPPVESTSGLVVSAQNLAAAAGVDILRQGGNAIDAAVAVGYAEAVVNPCCGNIGGGGFMTAHLADGRDIILNFRETAPAAAKQDMYLDAAGQPIRGASLFGWKAVAVPGSVLGLDTALSKYGTLPRAVVMAPAIRLAREGFVLGAGDADILARGPRFAARSSCRAYVSAADGAARRPATGCFSRTLPGHCKRSRTTGPMRFIRADAASGGSRLPQWWRDSSRRRISLPTG